MIEFDEFDLVRNFRSLKSKTDKLLFEIMFFAFIGLKSKNNSEVQIKKTEVATIGNTGHKTQTIKFEIEVSI